MGGERETRSDWLHAIVLRVGLPLALAVVFQLLAVKYGDLYAQSNPTVTSRFEPRLGIWQSFGLLAVVWTCHWLYGKWDNAKSEYGSSWLIRRIVGALFIPAWVVTVLALIFVFVAWATGTVAPGTSMFDRYWPMTWQYFMGIVVGTLVNGPMIVTLVAALTLWILHDWYRQRFHEASFSGQAVSTVVSIVFLVVGSIVFTSFALLVVRHVFAGTELSYLTAKPWPGDVMYSAGLLFSSGMLPAVILFLASSLLNGVPDIQFQNGMRIPSAGRWIVESVRNLIVMVSLLVFLASLEPLTAVSGRRWPVVATGLLGSLGAYTPWMIVLFLICMTGRRVLNGSASTWMTVGSIGSAAVGCWFLYRHIAQSAAAHKNPFEGIGAWYQQLRQTLMFGYKLDMRGFKSANLTLWGLLLGLILLLAIICLMFALFTAFTGGSPTSGGTGSATTSGSDSIQSSTRTITDALGNPIMTIRHELTGDYAYDSTGNRIGRVDQTLSGETLHTNQGDYHIRDGFSGKIIEHDGKTVGHLDDDGTYRN